MNYKTADYLKHNKIEKSIASLNKEKREAQIYI